MLIVTTALTLLVALAALGWELSEPWRTAPPGVAGQIALPASGGISLVDTSTGRARELVPGRSNASVTAAAWSPDRSTLAYSLFHRRPEDRVSSAELFTVPARGGEPTLVVPRVQPGSIVDAPAWAPDGSAIFFAFQGVENGTPVARVERVTLADGARSPLYGDASFPTVAPDGRSLAFVFDDGQGQALRVGSPDSDDAREIVAPRGFRSLMGPRYSPDGAWIAFAAVGPGPAGVAPAQRGQARPTGLAAIFSVPVAEAHGDPWSIWKIRPDGTDLQLATPLQEDEPLIAWSPDGAWIAVHGTGGLWLVDVRGAAEPRRIADGSIGGIDW